MALYQKYFTILLVDIVFLPKSDQNPTCPLGYPPHFAPFHGKSITIFLYIQILLYKQFNIFRPGPEVRGDRDRGQ